LGDGVGAVVERVERGDHTAAPDTDEAGAEEISQELAGQLKLFFFSYIFLGVIVYMEYLCRPSEASTWFCVIPGGYPPQD
jgi:hypothetical protein